MKIAATNFIRAGIRRHFKNSPPHDLFGLLRGALTLSRALSRLARSGCRRRSASCSLRVPRWCTGGRLASRSGFSRREPSTIPLERRYLIPSRLSKPSSSAPANSNMPPPLRLKPRHRAIFSTFACVRLMSETPNGQKRAAEAAGLAISRGDLSSGRSRARCCPTPAETSKKAAPKAR